MELLILVHVLSAVIGVGPIFFIPILLRKNQGIENLRFSMKTAKKLLLFPKTGGLTAVLTGILLILLSDYGSFYQLWLFGSLILYVAAQVILLGFIAPKQKKIALWLFDPKHKNETTIPQDIIQIRSKVNFLFYFAIALILIIFIFMILKPLAFV
ncbi:DUF2269 family protein [Chengkuizengella axinellae]|uniref:DUF2269 family protein n=1 Tax=Chengkuizengella axinellae TaxID=3064388 RepID=A0ABT9J0N3_9BACL|nr:DUF2269 family protein [Chengkuizengella sp. 2205SS18-9]MDP5275191.1 DUF2269 family protein [Chengkuizengella sp. 2205SS18-9]